MDEPKEATDHPEYPELSKQYPHRLITRRFIEGVEGARSSQARPEDETGHEERWGHQV